MFEVRVNNSVAVAVWKVAVSSIHPPVTTPFIPHNLDRSTRHTFDDKHEMGTEEFNISLPSAYRKLVSKVRKGQTSSSTSDISTVFAERELDTRKGSFA